MRNLKALSMSICIVSLTGLLACKDASFNSNQLGNRNNNSNQNSADTNGDGIPDSQQDKNNDGIPDFNQNGSGGSNGGGTVGNNGVTESGNGGSGSNSGGTSTGVGSTSADCSANPVFDASATFNTPIDVPYKTGDMNRRNTAGSTKEFIPKFVNPLCVANYNATGGTNVNNGGWQNPAVSGDKSTRDFVCQLYGYAGATDSSNFGYYQFASPHNDVAGTWNASTKTYTPIISAKSPISNKILIWTSCRGRLYDKCKNEFISSGFKCR